MIALLAALLLAQPLPQKAQPGGTVELHPEKAQKPSVLHGAAESLRGLVKRLWEREDNAVVQGSVALNNGDAYEALQRYEEADPRIPKTGDARAALELDKSSAHLKLGDGSKGLEEAQKALEAEDPSLRAKAAYNAAWAAEQSGKTDEAVAGYTRALSLDPTDADAKVNLELLLRDVERKKQQAGAQDPNAPKKPQDSQQQQQQQAGKGSGEQDKDQKQKAGEQDQQKQGQEQDKDKQQDQQQGKTEQKPAQQDENGKPQEQQAQQKPAQAQPQPLGRSEAQRLLDAARAGEKNLQVWRFGKQQQRPKSQKSTEKDW